MKFAFFLCFILNSLSSYADIPTKAVTQAIAMFPTTQKEIEKFKADALTDVDKSLNLFTSLNLQNLDYQTVVIGWEKAINPFLWRLAVLIFYHEITSDESLLGTAETEVQDLYETFQKISNNEKALNLVLTYAEQVVANPSKLDPSQAYILNQLIKSIMGDESKEKTRATELYAKTSLFEMLPYKYLQGDVLPKNISKDKLSILNWNTCCFDGGLSMIFGGALPWEDRIDGIAKVLQDSSADIICLQEFFSNEAASQLHSKLKKHYAHFYINIGPRVNGFNLRSLGISSGLFVASKYPLNNPQFHPYTADETPANRAYGFFTGEIADLNIRFVTTHLQPGSEAEDAKFRKAQVKAILSRIDGKSLTFMCGDLNIERDGTEYISEIAPCFLNNYKGTAWTCCEIKDYFWKAGQNVQKFQTMLHPEWIDYFLSWKDRPTTSIKSIQTSLITVNDTLKPWSALSDHQAMISIIEFNAH